jgi:hypothetical protein
MTEQQKQFHILRQTSQPKKRLPKNPFLEKVIVTGTHVGSDGRLRASVKRIPEQATAPAPPALQLSRAKGSSPEATRQALMGLASLGGAGVSVALLLSSAASGTALFVLCGVIALWIALFVQAVRMSNFANRT